MRKLEKNERKLTKLEISIIFNIIKKRGKINVANPPEKVLKMLHSYILDTDYEWMSIYENTRTQPKNAWKQRISKNLSLKLVYTKVKPMQK